MFISKINWLPPERCITLWHLEWHQNEDEIIILGGKIFKI